MSNYYKRHYHGTSRQAGSNPPSAENLTRMEKVDLIPNLLLACKDIFNEAAPILYGQPITVPDTYTLQAFLLAIGRPGAQRLAKLRITGWCSSRSQKSINLPTFGLLRDAVNLQSLSIDCIVPRYWWSSAKSDIAMAANVANKIYRDCYPWLATFHSAQRGNVWQDVLSVSNANYIPHTQDPEDWSPERVSSAKKFMEEQLMRLVQDNM
jgi:hypothetical protein